MPLLFLLLAGESMALPEDPERKAIALARETLAKKKNLSPGKISVRKVRAVEWPDTSLGCPEKGMSYAQVVVPGHLVHLQAGRALYAVHVGGGWSVVCERDRTGQERVSKELPAQLLEAVGEARRELARRLDVHESEVRLTAIRAARWTDPKQSCLDIPAASADNPVAGHLLEFKADDRTYRYHSDGRRTVPCDRQEGTGD